MPKMIVYNPDNGFNKQEYDRWHWHNVRKIDTEKYDEYKSKRVKKYHEKLEESREYFREYRQYQRKLIQKILELETRNKQLRLKNDKTGN